MTTRDLPSPPARGPMGHQPEYAADPLGTFARWTAAYGDAVFLRFGPTRALLVTSPRAVHHVLDAHADAFRKPNIIRRLAGRVIGRSIFVAEGEEWRRQRQAIAGYFSAANMDVQVSIIAEEVGLAADRWAAQGVVPLMAETMRLSQRIAARVLFGARATDEDVERVAAALEVTATDFQHGIDHPLSLLIPEWVPSRRRARLRRAVAVLTEVAARIIELRRQAPAGPDVLWQMLDLQRTAPWLTDRLIRDNVITLLTESREDPALLLTWSLYLLARHPTTADAVAREARQVTGVASVTAQQLPELRLAADVLREALRLYPPVYGTGREATRDSVVDGVRVTRGTTVLLSQHVMNHSASRHPDPDAFRPERWRERPQSSLEPGAFAPFGIGPRRCLGEHLAWRIGLTGLATLSTSLRFEIVDAAPVAPVVRLSLRPSREIRLRAERRTA